MSTVLPISVSISALLFQTMANDGSAVRSVAEVGLEASPRSEAFQQATGVRYFEGNIPFRPFLCAERESLGSSSLAPELQKACGAALDAALFGSIPVSRAADTLWWALGIDYFHRIPGASEPHIDPATGALEFRFPEKSLRNHDPISLAQRFQMIEKFLGGRLSLYSQKGGEIVISLYRLSAFQAAANVASEGSPLFGYGGSTRMVYALGEMPRDEINEAHLRDEVPVALPLKWIHLSHARDEVHPFPFAAHDLYHAVRIATLQAPVRRMAGGLYKAVRGLDPALRGFDFVEPMLDILSDKDFQNGTSDDLMHNAFSLLREEVGRDRELGSLDGTKRDLYRRFLAEAQAAWEPYIHEARTQHVDSFLKNLIP